MENLPEEIWCLVVDNLDPGDLVALSCTSFNLAKFYLKNKMLLHRHVCNRLMPFHPHLTNYSRNVIMVK